MDPLVADIFINFGVSVVLESVKNPAKKAKLKRAMLKVFLAIKAAYPGDPDFEFPGFKPDK